MAVTLSDSAGGQLAMAVTLSDSAGGQLAMAVTVSDSALHVHPFVMEKHV